MSVRTLGAQLFRFAVLLAALFVLPQVAHAHPGHAHVMHVHIGPLADAQMVDMSAADDDVSDHHLSAAHAEQSLSAAPESTPGHKHDTPCSDRDCCAQSSCAACFSIVAPLPPQVAPPSLSIAISLAANAQSSGIGGASLRRPPRSFA